MKTVEEIDALKRNWYDDPCWDIYDTEGFEDHYNQLFDYQTECEREWQNKNDEQNKLGANQLGLTVVDYLLYADLNYRTKNSSDHAKKLLLHYFNFNINIDSDMRGEIESIVDSIVDAAVNKISAELLLQKNK